MIRKLKVTEIVTDAGTQVRAGLNDGTVADYAEALADGAKFPPVVVFHDDGRFIAADGFHRIQAAIQTGASAIECEVRDGGKTEALKFALGCNAHHGLRRTNADKRHAVGLALREFPTASNAAIAEMCLVGHELVAEVRKLQSVDNQQNQMAQPYDSVGLSQPPTRIGRDGKERRLPPPPMRPRGTSPTDRTSGTSDADGRPMNDVPHLPPPPPPGPVLDATGWPIPTQLIPLWQRSGEVQELLTILSRVKGALRTAQDNRDILFAEVNFSSAQCQLGQAWTDVKTAKPFAVCPACQGQVPDQCTLCHGRGFISEYRWNTVIPREDKEFRSKAIARGKR